MKGIDRDVAIPGATRLPRLLVGNHAQRWQIDDNLIGLRAHRVSGPVDDEVRDHRAAGGGRTADSIAHRACQRLEEGGSNLVASDVQVDAGYGCLRATLLSLANRACMPDFGVKR